MEDFYGDVSIKRGLPGPENLRDTPLTDLSGYHVLADLYDFLALFLCTYLRHGHKKTGVAGISAIPVIIGICSKTVIS
jgi:hypothetical protein